MLRILLLIPVFYLSLRSFSQEKPFEKFISDSSLLHASVSVCIKNTGTKETIVDYNSERTLIPASLIKIITSAAALELLGPDYRFTTTIGYTGLINKKSGRLTGDIIIRGGGDPALGSKYFSDHYGDLAGACVMEIRKSGIKNIEGRIITDDSFYDFQPVPAKWLWEDAGNYYGAGAYGLSVFDNTYEITLDRSADSSIIISNITPDECRTELSNWLGVSGILNKGYVFAAPYGTHSWLAGTIPADTADFILKAAMTDPPLILAKMMTTWLERDGISVSDEPTTFRLEKGSISDEISSIYEIVSPPLSEIISVLNHESVNLYAEHIIKELGRVYRNNGSTASGAEVIFDFLRNAGIDTGGIFIEDGSGLSPSDGVNSRELVNLLIYMKDKGAYFREYYSSFPDAGKEGTLKYYFRDPVFDSRLKAKSGSMTRVRNYSGYFATQSGKEMVFSIMINNYAGPSQNIVTGIEEMLKEIILHY